MGNW